MFQLTQHAQSRIQQRGLSPDEVDYIIIMGKFFIGQAPFSIICGTKISPGRTGTRRESLV